MNSKVFVNNSTHRFYKKCGWLKIKVFLTEFLLVWEHSGWYFIKVQATSIHMSLQDRKLLTFFIILKNKRKNFFKIIIFLSKTNSVGYLTLWEFLIPAAFRLMTMIGIIIHRNCQVHKKFQASQCTRSEWDWNFVEGCSKPVNPTALSDAYHDLRYEGSIEKPRFRKLVNDL